MGLLRTLPYEDLSLARPDIEGLIQRFLPKRRRDLLSALDRRLRGAAVGPPAAHAPASGHETVGTRERGAGQPLLAQAPAARGLDYSVRLNALRDRHIFQWSTAYRETINYVFKDMVGADDTLEQFDARTKELGALFEDHATEIFQRGFNYITGTQDAAIDVDLAKSIGGLQRFVFLVIDAYSASKSTSKNAAVRVRAVTSSMVCGILRGYGRVHFRQMRGWDLLREYPTQWAHAIAFTTSTDLQSVLDASPPSDFIDGLRELIVPVQLAVDRVLLSLPPHAHALPRVGRFSQYPLRFETTLVAPTPAGRGTVRVASLLAAQSDPTLIEDSLASGADAVVAQVSAGLWHQHEGAWHGKVVDATRVGSQDDLVENVAERLIAIIATALAEPVTVAGGSRLLSRNAAGEFPLGDPIVRQFYLVQRHSVRQLLQTFADGTGAHVWCSVRRSGKTTATGDLAGDTDRTVVIVQTMDHQPGQPDLNIFFTRIMAALNAGAAIEPTFFASAVGDCALASSPAKLQGARKVFIVDEYETLFGLLNARARQDDWSRFAIVQPLLSQMVAFSTSNLLVFLGQRPDAHAILMSQNQLTPLIRQDSFPLFEHRQGSTTSEFAQFLSKVLEGMRVSPGFIDAVYAETSGHPYLTVNMMVDLCDWLISNHRAADLELESTDMEGFARDRLMPAVLQRSSYYSTFQQMMADSLSEVTRSSEPWLHAVAVVMQRICKQHPRALSCAEPRYREMASDVARLLNTTPGQLLQSAKMANFLAEGAGQVRPAIRLLGRLAAVSAAEVN